MTPLDAVARLRAVVEAMTPEPWTVKAQPETPSLPLLAGPPKPNGKRDVVALFPLMTEPDVKEANGKGILALRNLAGPLLAVVEAANAVTAIAFVPAPLLGEALRALDDALTALARAIEETA